MRAFWSFRFWRLFLGSYIGAVGTIWGFTQAYTYFQGEHLKQVMGSGWILLYAVPLPVALLFALRKGVGEDQLHNEVSTDDEESGDGPLTKTDTLPRAQPSSPDEAAQLTEIERHIQNDLPVAPSRIRDIRHRLNHSFDDPQIDAFLLDYFPDVYDRVSRGMRKDEKLSLLLDHCRRSETRIQYLISCLERTKNE